MFYEVIPEGKIEALTYRCSNSLLPGQIVMVPVGRRVVPGVVIKKVAQPDFDTKAIIKELYSKPLPSHLLGVVQFIHKYYMAPSGQAVSLILPRGIEKKRRKTEQMFGLGSRSEYLARDTLKGARPSLRSRAKYSRATETEQSFSQIPLNPAQKIALQALQKAPEATKLLFGVTGSGKTNIYLKMALNALQDHFSTILLVPEIALTGQLVQVFAKVFGKKVVVIHSGLKETERHLIFERILNSNEPLIVIGARSALFAPVARLGLIIIDEEHESTYYQENAPRYSAIRVASYLAKTLKIPLILGSATPTVEDYYIASKQNSVVSLTRKAKDTAIKPEIRIIDFKDRSCFGKNRYFSNSLLTAISDNLQNGRQTLIFHNRRGSAPLTICESCGEEILCPTCFLPLTLHADEYVLHCHTCGFSEKVPTACPHCGAPGLIHKGFGTKLLETELKKLFPKARISRFDADNKKGESLDAKYNAVKDGEIDILIGTQAIAKGLDLPRLATVGIVQADTGLSLPDYMAEEKTFQLLTQAIGRVGRGHCDKAEVIIQTFQPEHPAIKFATEEDYVGFYNYLVKKRQKAAFPPFRFVMKLEISMKTEATTLKKVQALARRLSVDDRLMVSPPSPAFHEHTSRGYTWQIIVRSRSRKALVDVCGDIDPNFKISLDPPGLL